MYLLARMTPSPSHSPQPSRVASFSTSFFSDSWSPQLGFSPSSCSGVIQPFSAHSVTQPSSQPASLMSTPVLSISFDRKTAAPASVTPTCEPIAAMPSYSGSSAVNPAYGPSVTVMILQQAIWQAQQGLFFHSKCERMYCPLMS